MRALASAAVLVGVLAVAVPAHAAIDDLTLISGALGGPPLKPDGPSRDPKLSADGRYVTFVSAATNLVAGDANGNQDVFRHDTLTGETLLVSRADGLAGAPGSSSSGEDGDRLAISADGRFVAFHSTADNLIVGDDDSVGNVYVRDVAAGKTYLANRTDADAAAVGGASGGEIDISGDGRYVVFTTEATNMPGTGAGEQVVRRDIVAEATTLVSSTPAGVAGNGDSGEPRISDDGTRVAFPTEAVNLGADSSNDRVVVRDLAANTIAIASRFDGPAGEPQVSFTGRISADGTKVGWSNGNANRFFVRNLAAGTTVEASFAPDGGPIPGFCCYDFELSGDGRYVASYAGDTDDYLVYHRDTVAGTTRMVSRPPGPGEELAHSQFSRGVAISDTGRYVGFGSTSIKLSDADYRGPTPGFNDSDVFLRDVLGPPPPVVPPDTTSPAISAVSLSRKSFRVGSGPTALTAAKKKVGARKKAKKRRAAAGTTLRYSLSEAATVAIEVQQRRAGVKLKRRGKSSCVPATKRNRNRLRKQLSKTPAVALPSGRERARALRKATRRAACVLWTKSGTLTRRSPAGKTSVVFSGRLGKRALKRGRYCLSITARDEAGNASRTHRVAFRIV